jgi:uncharacterized damage-inducible protein DinB
MMTAMPTTQIKTTQIKRVDPPETDGEVAQLTGFLDFLRATVHLKAADLSDADAHRATLRSPLMTIAGIVSHLRWVERYWFSEILGAVPNDPPYTDDNPDGDFTAAHGRPLAELLAEYAAECDTSRRVLAKLDLDTEVPFRDRLMTVRWVVIHMVEETGRHVGHLDVVRENLDGVTGE